MKPQYFLPDTRKSKRVLLENVCRHMPQIFTQKLCMNEYDLTFTAMKIKRPARCALASDKVCFYADGCGWVSSRTDNTRLHKFLNLSTLF
jgi:hypothetical protein